MKGMAFTSERERVRMLLGLVAHVSEYKMMVGAHNIVLMLDARGRLRRLLQVWQMSVLATLLIPRGMQGVLPCLPSTVNTGTHNTVDASGSTWGSLTVFV